MEPWNRARGIGIFQDQFLGEDQYGDFQGQFGFDDDTLALCLYLEALNAWDKVEESGKRS